jgi:transcription initiation factor TFIIIB Brf1 subunit/transcription initiation factor TFIIB
MKMKKCDECGITDSSFDEDMGEHTCNECGLVIITELFEETVHILNSSGENVRSADKGHLGSIITGEGSYKFNRFKRSVVPQNIQQGLLHCNMVLANFSPTEPFKERVEKIYMEAYRKNVFGKSSYENRATAVVFYALKERGTPIPLKKVMEEFEVEPKRVRRIIRKLNSLYRNQINFTEVNPAYQLEYHVLQITKDRNYLRQCLEVLARFENIVSNSNFTKNKSYYASICWITTNVFVRSEPTRKQISEAGGLNQSCVYEQTKSLLALIGKTSVKELRGKNVNKIGETNV